MKLSYNNLSWNSIVFHFNPSTRLSLSEEQKKKRLHIEKVFFCKDEKTDVPICLNNNFSAYKYR